MIIDEYKIFLSNGYFDEDGIAKKELFLDYPEKLVKEFKESKPTSYKQLRGVFNKTNEITMKLKSKEICFKEAMNELLLLNSKIEDKCGKGHIDNTFRKFFRINLDIMKEEKDVYCFAKHLQCVCNFYPKENKENSNKWETKSYPNNNYNTFKKRGY